MTRYLKHTRLPAGALAFVLGATVVAPPAYAAGPAPAPRPIAEAAAARVEAMPAAALVEAAAAVAPAAQAAPVADTGDKPFFKTTKGAIALVLLAGSVGYMAYSFSNDRVKSPLK